MKQGYVLMVLLFLVSCVHYQSTEDHGLGSARAFASIDNDGEPVDDSFDPHLETYYGGSAITEKQANEAVASIIRDAVAAQQKSRRDVLGSARRDTPEARRIFRDLPKSDYATRDVHRKTNGCFKAQLTIAPDLSQKVNEQISEYARMGSTQLAPLRNPESLGIFIPGESYDAIVRMSNGNPGNRPDKDPDARGFAVKILPQGTFDSTAIAEMSASKLNLDTQLDILSINFPTFFVNDPIQYAALNRGALGGAIDFKNSFAGQVEQLVAVFISSGFSSLSRKLTFLVNGSIIYSPLYQEYYSMVPSRLGPLGEIRAVKYSWAPVACGPENAKAFDVEKDKQWADWTNEHSYAFPPSVPSVISKPRTPYTKADFPRDYLRAHVIDRLAKGDFCFDFYLQLYRDALSTNIEDSTDIWLKSPIEKQWWREQVVPGPVEWRTSSHNLESRDNYLKRFDQKQIAPRVQAGRLVIKQLHGAEPATYWGNNKTCEDLSFSPWNGDIAHHKPLGIVSRMKRKVYNASRRERHQLNGINDEGIER